MAETMTTAVIMLIGSTMYAIFSNMASYIQSIDADVADFQQKMRDIRQQMNIAFLKNCGHIEMYYNYMWTCHKGLVEHKQYFYKDLRKSLHINHVLIHTCFSCTLLPHCIHHICVQINHSSGANVIFVFLQN